MAGDKQVPTLILIGVRFITTAINLAFGDDYLVDSLIFYSVKCLIRPLKRVI